MKIKESPYSRKRQFIELVNKYIPELYVKKEGENGWCLFFEHQNAPTQQLKLRVNKVSPFTAGEPLFANGEWEDLDVFVFDGAYFDNALKLTEDYESVSKKAVNIIKHF
jgi:hypothetical protein